MNMSSKMRKLNWLVGTGALVAFCGSGTVVAAPLDLQNVPLFVAQGAEPNVMIMMDNSGSMQNIVPDAPYDPNQVYLASCPAANQVPTQFRIDLRLQSSAPRIRYFIDLAGNNNDREVIEPWGTSGSSKCFVTGQDYMAMLNTEGAGSLPSQYTGNYLNWYFNSATNPAGCTEQWSQGRKPCTRSRMMIAKAAGTTLVGSMPAAMRGALSTYNNGNGGQLLSTMGLLDSAKRTAMTAAINAMTPSGNTPLGETLADIGWYYSRGATDLTLHPDADPMTQSRSTVFAIPTGTGSYTRDSSWATGSDPITYRCQKSFAVLLTDGRPQGDRNVSNSLADYDRDCVNADPACLTFDRKAGQEYESEGSDYLNDVAAALFDMDLRPDLGVTKNNVVTYLISFADDQAINDPLMSSTARQGGSNDKFIAGNEAQLTAAFGAAIEDITQKSASASSAAVNSGSVSTDTRVFQARFNPVTWTGQLLSYGVNSDGTLRTTADTDDETADPWEASLPAHGSRQIITVNTLGTPTAFRWSSATGGTFLDTTRKERLNNDEAVLNYLRGSDANEGSGATNFRVRRDDAGPNKLGDIVSSSPLFVGRPPFRYRDSLESAPYSAFANTNRRPMVYVGANDGMLHGFDADTGREVFAFIPSPLFEPRSEADQLSRLNALASKTYSHEFYVDGSPSMGDVFFGGSWHTVLVGGLNKGGRGIYALDITNPATLAGAESSPGSVVMWEFTPEDDPDDPNDLGFTYSQPAIGKMQNGTWVAVFGNGYNSSPSGTSSPGGKAILYIVDIANGNLIKKIVTTPPTAAPGVTWDNGLSTPSLVDTNGDRKVDAVYAGDLRGNLWKFDVSSTNPTNWGVAFSGAPLFKATDGTPAANAQPITVRPEVARGPQGRPIVLFGTGKYLELADKSPSPTRMQSFYGIIDGGSVVERNNLLRQEVTREGFRPDPDGDGPKTALNLRFTSDYDLETTDAGWYLDLQRPASFSERYQGEKQVTNPSVRDGRVSFTTLIPNPDPCLAGGSSWSMTLDILSGGRVENAIDTNGDNEIDNDDKVDGEGASGAQNANGDPAINQGAGSLEGENGNCVVYKYMPDSAGKMFQVTESCGPGGMGRQSWRQIR